VLRGNLKLYISSNSKDIRDKTLALFKQYNIQFEELKEKGIKE